MVPHSILLYKLERFGVCGRALQFFQTLYASSQASVRDLADGNNGEPFTPTRGVRQGCPSSPLMFNIFINDLFDFCARFLKNNSINGSLTGLSQNADIHMFFPGLLFADDVVLCAESIAALQKQLFAVELWTRMNRMALNVNKCGVMAVNTNVARSNKRQQVLRKKPIIVAGKAVPVVDTYTYLGMPFNRVLDIKQMAMARRDQVAPAMKAIAGFCRNPEYPLCAKVKLLATVALPKVSYGAEIFGMNSVFSRPLASAYNNTIKAICKPWGNPSATLLSNETGLPSFTTQAAAARARLLLKLTTTSQTFGRNWDRAHEVLRPQADLDHFRSQVAQQPRHRGQRQRLDPGEDHQDCPRALREARRQDADKG